MDAIRYRLAQDTFTDVTAFADAELKYEGNVTQLLWPDVVFAVAQ